VGQTKTQEQGKSRPEAKLEVMSGADIIDWYAGEGQRGAARKISAALAAGCSIIIKCPEETPGSPIGLVRCFRDADVPPGVVNLVYGVPAEISEYLIPLPVIRKISFTGSEVGKHLNALAASHMKRACSRTPTSTERPS